jgi:hypothetical protein
VANLVEEFAAASVTVFMRTLTSAPNSSLAADEEATILSNPSVVSELRRKSWLE